jgi:hypothetical protein
VTLTERIVQTTTASAVPHDVALVTPASSPAVAAARAVTASALTTIATSTRRLETPRATESPVPSASPEPPAPPAQQKPATLSGVLRDATGAVVPGVTVTVTDTATGMRHSTTTDAIGAFTIRNLPPSTYEFRASLPGFASIADVVTLADGADVQRRWEMRVGGVTETIVVTCPAGAAALPASAGVLAFENRRAPTSLFAQQAPVRVGGSIAAPRQNKRVQPRCPGIQPPADGIVVILEATIAVDGQTKDVRSLRPVPGQQGFPSAFVDAAVEAIRQWEFTPTRLNNVPVPVIVTVTVSYRRE